MGRNIQSAVLSLCLLAAASSLCAGQTVTSSAQIPGLRPYKVDLEYMPRAEKDSVRMVAELWKGGDEVTAAVLPIESLIGAAVVEYALSEGGYSLVRSLLECGSYAGADGFIRGLL